MKMVSGILARDNDGCGMVVFFLDAEPVDVSPNRFGAWLYCDRFECTKAWLIKDWKATYNLKAPAKGKCFEAEIEL